MVIRHRPDEPRGGNPDDPQARHKVVIIGVVPSRQLRPLGDVSHCETPPRALRLMIVLRLKRKNDVYVMPDTQSQRGAGLHAEHWASQFAAGRLGLLGGGRECDLKHLEAPDCRVNCYTQPSRSRAQVLYYATL